MSHKKAKKQRREEKAEANEPKPIGQIIIDVYPDMGVSVRGFPTEHSAAMIILCNAIRGVSDYFVQQSINNKSDILIAKPGMSPDDMARVMRVN